MTNEATSRFLDWSLQRGMDIYGMAFTQDFANTWPSDQHRPAFSLATRQVHDEAVDIYWASTSVNIDMVLRYPEESIPKSCWPTIKRAVRSSAWWHR